ncbi:MAG: DUF4105 domain-containing protein [Verrucomicrobia bacterium]|nr:DUF4105 domain-containing protein [Verrucomicrobiota bacterium]MCH8510801.1 DUF4105 domain-containing protein [Kiritimatiellia bacterium]
MCFFVFALFFSGPVPAEIPDVSEPDLFPELWEIAKDLELWNHPEWWSLGHYHRTLWLRVESRIDDPRFFIAPNGKTNRRAELKATLRAFTSPDPAEETEERTLSCRFPARRRWLLEKLALPEDAFASPDCDTYHQVIAQLQIERATVVYPAAYLNNPASMFGHLLLVLDREGKSRLLSRAVNYGADVDTGFGPLYMIKGIFGLYDGMFAVMSYDQKVSEYNSVNRRDIWEYPLNLDGDGLDRLLRRVWELQELKSRYFFFKENCAFNLMYPIEAAHPDIQITRGFRFSAIPVSLLKELTATGITGEPVYRPSKSTVMAHLADKLTPEQRARALSIARGESPAEEEAEALVLSLAMELTFFDYTEKRIPPETYRERVTPIMMARSALGAAPVPQPPVPPAPETSHDPRRIFLYGGTDREGTGLGGVRLRAAYHDWLDVPTGFAPGSYITFFEADLRASNDFERWSLHRLTLVDIRSLAPRTLWTSPLSWTVSFRVEEDRFQPEHHRGVAQFATGKTWRTGENTLAYLKLENTIVADQTLPHTLAWEPGVQWGFAREGERLRAGLRGHHRFGVWGSAAARHSAEAEVRWTPAPEHVPNLSVGLLFAHFHEKGEDVQDRLFTLGLTF